MMSNDLILGAGRRVFDVAAYRLKDEYGVEAVFEPVQVSTARWIRCDDARKLEEFRDKNAMNLAIDAAGELVYLAPRPGQPAAGRSAPSVASPPASTCRRRAESNYKESCHVRIMHFVKLSKTVST